MYMSVRPARTMGDVNMAGISGSGAYARTTAGAMSPKREQKQLNCKLDIWTWGGKSRHDRGKLVLITNSKSHMSFRLAPKSVTLNGVMVLILRYFTEFGSFRGALSKSG